MATTGVVNGALMGVYLGTTLVALGTGCKLSIKHKPRETSNKDAGAYATKLEGQLEWSISGSGYFDFGTGGAQALITGILARTLFTVMIKSSVTGDKSYSGSAWLNSFEADFPDQESSTYSFSFESTGGLSVAST